MKHIVWASLDNLWSLLFVGASFFLLVYTTLRKKRFADSLLQHSILCNFSSVKNWIKVTLLTMGLIFLCLALLRPQWDQQEETIEQQGRDIFIALDVSRSMLAKDVKPNRLELAKKKVKQLLKQLESERVGLILFSGSTFIQCPLTSDYDAFYMYLDQIDVETISSGSTAIDQAIRKALQAFSVTPNKKSKLLLLLTDGEDFSSNLAGVKQQAQKEGMSIFALGLGTQEGAPVPVVDERGNHQGYQKDKKGNVVISRLNEGILANLAHDSGGTYVHAIQDKSDLKRIVQSVQKFEKEFFEDKTVKTAQEQYHYFLLVSFFCFALEWIL